VGQHFTKILREPLSFTYEARFWPRPPPKAALKSLGEFSTAGIGY